MRGVRCLSLFLALLCSCSIRSAAFVLPADSVDKNGPSTTRTTRCPRPSSSSPSALHADIIPGVVASATTMETAFMVLPPAVLVAAATTTLLAARQQRDTIGYQQDYELTQMKMLRDAVSSKQQRAKVCAKLHGWLYFCIGFSLLEKNIGCVRIVQYYLPAFTIVGYVTHFSLFNSRFLFISYTHT